MSDSATNTDRLFALAGAVFDKSASDRDCIELNAVLLADGDDRRLFLKFCQMHMALRVDLRARRAIQKTRQHINIGSTAVASDDSHAVNVETPLSSLAGFAPPRIHDIADYFSSGWPVAYLVAVVIVGVGLVIGAITHVSQPAYFADGASPVTEREIEPAASMQFVGRITGMVDCTWADPQTEAFNGASVPLGRKYALGSGLLEITYDTGAKVILQGPCTYEVESPAGGFLSVGKLTAKVEKGPRSKAQGPGTAEVASGQWSVVGESQMSNSPSPMSNSEQRVIGHSSLVIGHSSPNPQSLIPNPYFAVRTPTATVTDLGTEFGVEVAESGATFAHVYDGVVEMQSIERDGQRGQTVRLVKNESARVGQDNSGKVVLVRDAKIAPSAFVRVGQLSKVAEESHFKAFHRWQAYSEKLRHDPSLLAYYDFQRQEDSPSILRNVAADDNRSLDGVIENATWTAGRMVGKDALQFEDSHDYVSVHLPGKTDDLTLVAWVYAKWLENPLNALLTSDTWCQQGMIHWQLSSDGRMVFDVFDGGKRSLAYQSAEPLGRERFYRWIQLAVTYSRETESLAFYVNGNASGESRLSQHVPVTIGPARIGHWNGAGTDSAVRNFRGRIDELAVFRRVCSRDEIQRLFEAGKPPDKK